MKTSKTPENATVTPTQKKLKQARLPFKLISDISPKPETAQTRKRKLSVPDAEPVTKVGKISKENDLTDELVVISDDEGKDCQNPQKEEKPVNPFVKLVDNARKKKLQKKTSKKKTKSKSKKLRNGSVEISTATTTECEVMETDDVEMVEVDVQIHTESDDNDQNGLETDAPNDEHSGNKFDDTTGNSAPTHKEKPEMCDNVQTPTLEEPGKSAIHDTTAENIKKSIKSVCDIFCIDDSNNSSDIQSESKTEESVEPQTTEVIPDMKNTDFNDKDSNTTQESPGKMELGEVDITKVIENQVTPKRSARNKAKADELAQANKAKADEKANLNTSTTSSKLDESVSSDPTTPRHNTRSSSVTNSLGDESLNESSTVTANLTPKQLQKKLESAKKRQEREMEKQEREKKRQQEKEERAKQRQEKEDQKKREREEKEEVKRKEREEKEEQKKKEREEKEKQRESEKKLRELKEEQKRKEKEDKEEQRKKEKEAREEERRKRQEALDLEKQEQELKKKKAAEAFVNFFVPKQKVEKEETTGPISKNSMLSSFTIKSDMRLAPTVRVDFSDDKREVLDNELEEQNVSKVALYLKSLKEGKVKPLSRGKTWPLSDKDNDDDVMIVEDELPPIDSTGEIVTCELAIREKLRPKLLSFHDNRRPPYWGTWRKKSACIKPRRPLGQDQKQLDYEADSDEEWEEEQEGESLDGSACGSDEELDAKDDYEVDNEVFVPHGYLSDEEATMDEDDMLSLSPETQKARLKHLEDEFESEMKKPTEKLKPRLYGILWETKEGGKPEKCVDALWNYFEKFAMILDDPTPLLQPSNEPEESEKKKVKKKKVLAEGEEKSPKPDKKKKAKSEAKESKKPKVEARKPAPNQPGINSFLTKIKTT